MNRRAFFARTVGAMVAAVLPWKASTVQRLTLKGVPVVFDSDTPSKMLFVPSDRQIYFLNSDGPWVLNASNSRRLF